MSAAYFTHLDGGHDGFKRISEYKMQTCSFVSKSVPLVGGARRWQAIQQSCVKSLETCRRSVWMRADVHDGSHAVTSGQACGSISLDRSPQVLKGNKTTHKYSGRKTSRRPRQVSYDTSGSVKISSPSLLDRQKILAKKIKSHGQRGDWCGALKVLRSANKEVASRWCYNAAVSAMAGCAKWQEALALLSEMRREGIFPDQHTYSAAMRACGRAGRAHDAILLLESMKAEARERREKFDGRAPAGDGVVGPDAFCYNVCISAAEKGGLYDRASSLLEEMRSEGIKPDVYSFNSVINALGMAGRWREALGIMDKMVVEGVSPNPVTYASAINACGMSRQLEKALDLLREARIAGVEVRTSVYNAAITACGHAGSAKEAIPLLEEMRACGVPRSVITYSALISVCGKGGMPDTALRLLDEMKAEGIVPNGITYNAAIHASAGGGANSGGSGVRALIGGAGESSSLSRDKEGQGSAAQGERGVVSSAASQQHGVALDGDDVREDTVELAGAGEGNQGPRRWDRVMPLMEEMQAAGYVPDLLSFNLALAACAREGEAARALRLLGEMRKAGLLPTSVSYGSALASFQRAGDVDQALILLERMKAAGIRQNLITFNTALLACAKEGRQATALRLLGEMKDQGIEPNERSFRYAIEACGRAGDAASALTIFRGMPKVGVTPRVETITSTMEAFAVQGDLEQVLSLLEDARSLANGRSPHLPCVAVAARAYAAAGRAADAIHLLQNLSGQRYRESSENHKNEPSLSSTGKPLTVAPSASEFPRVGDARSLGAHADMDENQEQDVVDESAPIQKGRDELEGEVDDATRVTQEDVEGAWRRTLKAAARGGHVAATLDLLSTMRATGISISAKEYARAVETLTDGSDHSS